jgi:RHS repeat-associated protein
LGWSNGRELTTLSGNGVEASYTYDADGLRATKTDNGIKTTYEYVGGQLLYQKKGNTEVHYLYDANISLKGIQTVDGSGTVSNHFVVTNTRYDDSGNLQVSYTYDAWEKILSIKDGNGNEITNNGNIGKLNSLRFRSYYYDDETGLYYLQSRYYNPEWGRFINADRIIDTGLGLSGTNMFTYCVNNPIMYFDPSGYITADWRGLREVDGQYLYGDLAYYIIAAGSYAYSKMPKAYKISVNGKSSYGNVSGSTAVPYPAPPNPNGNKKGNSDTKQQLNKLKKNSDANKIAEEYGYKKAEDFKQEYVGKQNVSKFNIKYNPKTGEIVLEAIQGGKQVSTGLKMPKGLW